MKGDRDDPEKQDAEKQSKDPQVRVVDRRWWARGDGAAPADEAASRKPTVVEDLKQRLAETANQLQTSMAEHRRSLEEFEQVKNYELRRVNVSREVERGRRTVLVELLDVVDNLDRAISAADETSASATADTSERLARGVRLVRDQFLAKLEHFGVVRVPAIGQRFDAAHHQEAKPRPRP